MIFGSHAIMYSGDANADREFLRDILGFSSVDAGRGWLIFALPPAEVAVHPAEAETPRHELYLMCDDVRAEVKRLQQHGVECDDISEQPWGKLTYIVLPSGARLGLYQPQHPLAIKR
jgi:catechol 2,3-dioxygenase-like lactoylglutathione lyase family enzyme